MSINLFEQVNCISVQNWDALVEVTYNRPYSFQQQDGCKVRGIHSLTIPDNEDYDYDNHEVPEIVNGDIMGVSFKAWLERDPNQKLKNQEYSHELELWWERNFYPHVQMIANDLYKKEILPAGEYIINIDW